MIELLLPLSVDPAKWDPATWGFIGVVIGGVITAIVTLGAEWIRGGHESTLDKERRADDRRLGRDAFQRQNLLELQECLAVWARAEGAAMAFDQLTFRKTGTLSLLPDAMDAEILETGRQLGYRIQRATDDELRRTLDELTRLAAALQVERAMNRAAVTEASFEVDLRRFGDGYTKAQTLLGERLRTYL